MSIVNDIPLPPTPPNSPETKKSLKRQKTSDGNSKKSDTTNQTLLLAYTYSLNVQGTKVCSVGFDSLDTEFGSSVQLKDISGRTNVILSSLEWYTLFTNFNKINDLLTKEIDNEVFETKGENVSSLIDSLPSSTTKKIRQQKGVCKIQQMEYVILSQPMNIYVVTQCNSKTKEVDRTVVISRSIDKKTRINVSFNTTEWRKLIVLSEFINNIVTRNRQTSYLVTTYFQQYLVKCIEHKKQVLDSTITLFTHTTDLINFNRLFYEIPILCESRIKQSIEMTKKIISTSPAPSSSSASSSSSSSVVSV